jgi:hypothetical protein
VSDSSHQELFWLANRLALRPEEAARALGISERTLRRLGPRLPRIHDGGVVLYPVEGLRRWLQEQAEVEGHATDEAVREVLDGISG